MGLEKPFRMANPPWDAIAAFRPEVCIHCAWIATPGVYLESPKNVHHREWSLTMIRRLAAMGTRRFVVAGTCAEYGASNEPLREEEEASPVTIYGREKNLLRVALEEESMKLGFELLWTRIFYPYGPAEHPQRLISSLIRGWETGNPLRLNNPQCVRDYIHVEDVATALLVIAEQRMMGTINVGTGIGVRLGEMDCLVRERMGISLEVGVSLLDSMGLHDSVIADSKKLKSLGWNPQYDIKSGINSFFDSSNRVLNQLSCSRLSSNR